MPILYPTTHLQQLQVVHHDQSQFLLMMESSGTCTNRQGVQTRRVVDIDRRFSHPVDSLDDLAPLHVVEFRFSHLGSADMGGCTEEIHRDLVITHFKAEDGDWNLVDQSGMTSHIESEGCFPHRWTTCHHHQVGGLETVGQFIEILETGQNTDRSLFPLLDVLDDLVEAFMHGMDTLLRIVLGQCQYLATRFIDQVTNLTRPGSCSGFQILTHLNHPSPLRGFLDDPGIFKKIGTGLNPTGQIDQVLLTAGLIQSTARSQSIDQHHGICDPLIGPQMQHFVVDDSVTGEVKFVPLDRSHDRMTVGSPQHQ